MLISYEAVLQKPSYDNNSRGFPLESTVFKFLGHYRPRIFLVLMLVKRKKINLNAVRAIYQGMLSEIFIKGSLRVIECDAACIKYQSIRRIF